MKHHCILWRFFFGTYAPSCVDRFLWVIELSKLWIYILYVNTWRHIDVMPPFPTNSCIFFNKTLQLFIRCENLHDFGLTIKLTSKVNTVWFTYVCFIISRVNSGWTSIENMEKQIRKIAKLEQTQLLFTWDEDWRKPNNFLEKQIFEGNTRITSYLTKCLFSFWFSIWCHQWHFLSFMRLVY